MLRAATRRWPSQELVPRHVEQGAKQAPSSQFAERAGSGLQAMPQEHRASWGWVYLRRCAYKNFSLVLSCEGFLKHASIAQRDEAQRTEVQ